MSVHFLTNTLDKWDAAQGDALALTFFSDERPLRGATGLADWRLCGRLSRLIKRGKLSGRRGETLMLPPGNRLPFPKVILFGLGNSADWNEAVFRERIAWILDVLERAKVGSYALQAPGRATGLIAPRRALELWLEATSQLRSGGADEVSVIDVPAAHKEMAAALRRFQRSRTPVG